VLIEALQAQLADAEDAGGVAPSVTRSTGAAARQQRYRQRKRNGVTTPDRNASPVDNDRNAAASPEVEGRDGLFPLMP
jgi:hypothetical protein